MAAKATKEANKAVAAKKAVEGKDKDKAMDSQGNKGKANPAKKAALPAKKDVGEKAAKNEKDAATGGPQLRPRPRNPEPAPEV